MGSIDPAQVMEAELVAQSSVINETIARQESPVQQFYAGAVVLVTGASGFLGKQLIEKLFRSCKVQKIYILMRAKKQKTFQARKDELVQDMLFEYLHNTQPDFVNKLLPVAGDISELKLGMSEKNWMHLVEEVNVIFHVAATINFVEPLRVATLTNVRGTREMLVLAKDCKKLKSFVYVSTAYSHATTDRINQQVLEQFYEVPLSPNFLMQLVDELSASRLDDITPKLIDNWPNTYAFTKAIAEELVRTMAGDLPVCIVRPAIVLTACREPPGWVDKTTINGPIGFILGASLGGLHTIYNSDNRMDFVPVDLVNNAIIAAAQETAARHQRGEFDCKIYTVTTTRNPIKFNDLYAVVNSKVCRDYMSPKQLWHPYVVATKSKILYLLLSWLLHFIPGYLADAVLRLLGKKPKVIRLFNRAYKQNNIYSHYMLNEWHFGDSNLLEMYQSLSQEDRIIYNCDITSIDWTHYALTSTIGVRKYILKDGLQGTVYARKKAFLLKILNAIYLALYAFVIYKIFSMFYWTVQFMVQAVLA